MSHTDTQNYDPALMWDNFALARGAVRTVNHDLMVAWHTARDTDTAIAIDDKREARRWITREIERYPLHPVIEAAVMASRPCDWHQLFLEWPHTSQGDRSKIAYTQNEDKGRRDIQTVTSVGKYLRRHFPALSDHEIRDLSARFGTASQFKFVHTTAEMIYHLHKGPGSCMVWGNDRGVRCSDGVQRHPYEAYDPKYGWHMAVRTDGDETVGRALCMTNPNCGTKYYVRTYARPASSGGYSETDNGMENWLSEQGYDKHSYWEDGERLAYHEASDHFLAPYLDGSEKRVTIDAGNKCLVIDSDGEYNCDQTGGCPSYEDADRFECACCGDWTDDDDGYWVERSEEVRVCESCLSNEYTYVYGRRGNQYHVHNDNIVYVDSQNEYYDEDYLSDNSIVELTNGEYEHMDEAIEINGDWYTIDDDRICRFEDTDEYGLCEDGWQCVASCNWYTDDCTSFTEYKGERYHDDYIPQEVADATADKRIDEDEADTTPQATMLTIDMLWKEQMLWDYTIAMDKVTVSLTYTHDGHKLHAERTFLQEFVNSVDRSEFNRILRNELCSALVLQAHNNSVATI